MLEKLTQTFRNFLTRHPRLPSNNGRPKLDEDNLLRKYS